MTSGAIRYVWKITRPDDPRVIAALIKAAYETAKQTDPDVCEILIRYRKQPSIVG
jgi:hypothetical protein